MRGMEKSDIKLKKIKIGLLGDSCTGKSLICNTFSGIEFKEEMICVDRFEKIIKLENGEEIQLILWDNSGAERFRSIAFKSIKSVQGIALVFDITSKYSFNNLNQWLEDIKENFSNHPLVLLGNKTDRKKCDWQVTQEDIDGFVKQNNIKYFAVSAKTNKGINESTNYLANFIYYKNIIKKELDEKYSEENQNKELKELKNVLNNIKRKYEQLKKDYDILKKNYEKIKEDNTKLNNELNKAKYFISNIESKEKENIIEINNLKNRIIQKDDEINILNLKIKNIESFSKTSFNNDDIISVHFISPDQNINCPIKCLKNDTFAEVEEKLYQKCQKYRETNNKFISKGKIVMRFKKIIENNINDGDKIELINLE